MTRPIVIFGAGDIAELAAYYFETDTERQVVAFTVDSAYRDGDRFAGKPIVDFETISETHPPSDFDLFIALSYSKLNALREEKFKAAKALGYALPGYKSSRASVFDNVKIGENCFILEDNTVQPFVTIGDNVTLWSGNHIGHHSTIEDHVFISSHVVVSGGVTVRNNSFLGVNATLRDHITVGSHCVVGANALLLADADDSGVYIGTATERSRVPSTRLRSI